MHLSSLHQTGLVPYWHPSDDIDAGAYLAVLGVVVCVEAGGCGQAGNCGLGPGDGPAPGLGRKRAVCQLTALLLTLQGST